MKAPAGGLLSLFSHKVHSFFGPPQTRKPSHFRRLAWKFAVHRRRGGDKETTPPKEGEGTRSCGSRKCDAPSLRVGPSSSCLEPPTADSIRCRPTAVPSTSTVLAPCSPVVILPTHKHPSPHVPLQDSFMTTQPRSPPAPELPPRLASTRSPTSAFAHSVVWSTSSSQPAPPLARLAFALHPQSTPSSFPLVLFFILQSAQSPSQVRHPLVVPGPRAGDRIRLLIRHHDRFLSAPTLNQETPFLTQSKELALRFPASGLLEPAPDLAGDLIASGDSRTRPLTNQNSLGYRSAFSPGGLDSLILLGILRDLMSTAASTRSIPTVPFLILQIFCTQTFLQRAGRRA